MIFLGCLFDKKNEESILNKSKLGVSNAVNTFQWNLIDGFNANLEKPVDIINVLPIGVYPFQYKQLFLKTKKWQYNGSSNIEVGSINIPFLKQFSRKQKIKKLLKKTEDKNIIVYSTYLPFLKAIEKLDKSYNITLVVADLPEFYDFGKISSLKRFLRKQNNKQIYKTLNRVDKFVLLTEQMKYPLQVGERPYTVVEGIANGLEESFNKSLNKKVVFYAGSLRYVFGIKTLLDGFCMTTNEDYELWLCGRGDAEEEIKELAEKDKRIKFFGFCSKQRVNELQQQATVLVNPRKNEGEYTKYSFPSKTMEYLVAGKPVLMYKLDGVPGEYDKYLNYITGNEPEDIKKSLEVLLEKPEQELTKLAEEAKQWVLEEKSSIKQTEKIIRMVFNDKNW
ncbi:MAG: glycosyltransferase [Clostridia bacterium]|nr:glycosyltransferase [Clostridia bacterium]